MATLAYRGRPLETDPDVSTRDYTSAKKAADLTTDQVEALINSGLSGYADKSYVDAQDAKNATRAYIDAQDNLRLKLASIGLANGIAGLDASGRIPPQFINAPLTQRYFRGPWSPPAYFTNPIDCTTETTLYTVNITDPGYPYQLMVFGEVDLRTNMDGEYGIVNVRAGSATGEIIAQGLGASAANEYAVPGFGDQFVAPEGNWPNGWAFTALDGGIGAYLVTSGNLLWQAEGGSPHTLFYRRTDPADAITLTDWQKVSTQIAVQASAASGGGDQTFALFGRMNTAQTDYIGANIVGPSTAYLSYVRGGSGFQMQNGVNGFVVSPANAVGVNTSAGSTFDLICGHVGGLRQFAIMNNGQIIQTATDVNNVTALGSAYRGWGFYGHADTRFFGLTQTIPPGLAYMVAGDAGPNSKMVSIVPANNPSMVVRSGAITLYVRGVRSGSASTIHAAPVHPSIFPIAFPAG